MFKDIKINIRQNFLLLTAVFIPYLLTTLYFIDLSGFSDDQTSYFLRAQMIAAGDAGYQAGHFFPYILAKIYQLTGDFKTSFIVIYALVCFAYFHLTHAGFDIILKNRMVSLFLTIISLTPHYTLGMTFWGFAGSEFITARILIMPFVVPILAVYLTNLDKPGVFWLYGLCIILSLLHLSAIYLLGVMIVYYCLYRLVKRRFKPDKAAIYFLTASAWSGVWVLAMLYLIPGQHLDYFLIDTYRVITRVNHEYALSLTDREYLNLLWGSMSAAFWWAMFPPKLTDLFYAVTESFFLLAFAAAGFAALKKERGDLFRAMIMLMVSVLAVSYGFQTFCWIGWKLFGLGPKIYEEVRAFKFIYFPIFIAIGFFLMRPNRKFKVVILILLVISPFGLVRMTPNGLKLSMVEQFDRLFPNPIYHEYVEKALKIKSVDEAEITQLIKIIKKEAPEEATILTTIHKIKQSGRRIIISYQDKRSGRQGFTGPRKDEIVYWHLAYQEVSRVIKSRDPKHIRDTARKYNANYVILENRQDDPGLKPMFEGNRYFLYEVKLD